MFKAFFFDMDGVLLDSMPHHVVAWKETLSRYGIHFEPRDCYLNEGRPSRDVIRLLAQRQGMELREDVLETIYQEKTAAYRRQEQSGPMHGVGDVLNYICSQQVDGQAPQIWVVTGGGQKDLYEQLEQFFPGVFRRERMITAMDVTHGKPAPEPYLKAWERSGLKKEECCIVENAPLGCAAGKAAGIFTVGVNTGVLQDEDLANNGASIVFPSMPAFLERLNDWQRKS